MQWLHFPKIPSTHLFAKQHIKQLLGDKKNVELRSPQCQVKALVTCDEQTQGIGRRGGEWRSRSGDLLATYLLDLLTCKLNELSGLIALTAAGALFDALIPFLGDSMRDIWIKWPNDLYLDDQKIAGLIAEQIDDGRIILLSIGVNLAKRDEPYHFKQSPFATLNKKSQICPMMLAKQMTGTLTDHFQRLYHNHDSAPVPIHFGFKLVLGTSISFCFSHHEVERQRAIYRGIDRLGQLIVFWQNQLLHLRSEQICKLQIESS